MYVYVYIERERERERERPFPLARPNNLVAQVEWGAGMNQITTKAFRGQSGITKEHFWVNLVLLKIIWGLT